MLRNADRRGRRYGVLLDRLSTQVVPRRGGPLLQSWRRKAALVLHAMVLIVCLAPFVASLVSNALARRVLLSSSFAIDIVALSHDGDALAAQ